MNQQPNSRYCLLCGIDNPIGLNLRFYEEGDDRVVARFTPLPEHQGYPGVLHGGLTSALLDETIGRTLVPHDLWAMTVELNVRFRRPIPVGQPLTVIGELVRLRSRTMEGRGEVRLAEAPLPPPPRPSTSPLCRADGRVSRGTRLVAGGPRRTGERSAAPVAVRRRNTAPER